MKLILPMAGLNNTREIDPNEDQGTDAGWASAAKARKSRERDNGHEAPPGFENQAKNDFGDAVLDGSVSQEDLDCGYDELGDYSNGFLKRNNYFERN